MKLFTTVVIIVLVLGVAYTGGGGVVAQDGAEATIEAQKTEITEIRATSQARGEKINIQRTQIADLKAQLPVVNDDPAIGDVFAIRNFELTVQGTDTFEVVGSSFSPQNANGIYLVVYLDVANVTDSPLIFPYDDFQVGDGRSRSYSYDSTAGIYFLSDTFDGTSPFDELQPGIVYSIAVIFDVPVDSTGFTLSTSRNDFEAPLDR